MLKYDQGAEFKECRKALIKVQAQHHTENDCLQKSMEKIIRKHSLGVDLATFGFWPARYPRQNISRQMSTH